MKTKLKYLFLALLGLILIPTTNAYELGVNLNWTNADYDVEYRDAKFAFYNSSYPYIVARPCSDSSQGSKCFSAPYDSSSIFDYSYRIHVSLSSWSFEKFFGVAYKDNWEWRDFYYSVYSSDNKAVQKLFNVPSRTAFSVKMTNGKEYIMDTVYFYHNTLVFMDSRNGFTLYLNGNLKASDWVVFVDPFLKEDNFFFIRFKEKKAWSMTVSEPEAWNWFFWKKNWELLKTLKFTKSYEVREWWETIFPINFHVWKNKQGWPWYTYQEDIEFVSPEWNAGKPSNNWTGNQIAQNYRACVSKRSDIKILAQISKTCGDDPADEETLNWVKVDSWNWDGDVKTILDQLTGKNKTKCGRYANTKKKYHDKYSKEWEIFSKDFNNYAFTPEAIDVQAQCRWEELEQEHWSAGSYNVVWSQDTPITNKVKSRPLFWWVSDNIYDPVANFVSDSVIGLLWKKDSVICVDKNSWTKYTAQDVINDELLLKQSFNDWNTLSGVQNTIYEKYKWCSDETHYIRNHLWDIWNKKFKGQWMVSSFVSLIEVEYKKWENFFPVVYCSQNSWFNSAEYDKILWVIFIVVVLYFYKIIS